MLITRNILVTGATGFIGEQTSGHLANEGHTVYALVREGSNCDYLDQRIKKEIFDGNIDTLANFMKQRSIDAVVHIASLFIAEHKPEQVGSLVDSNVKFGTQILEAMNIAGVRYFINTSSTWQHFEPCTEAYHPVNLYAATKEAFEKIVDYYVEATGIQAVTLSIFDSYGAGDRRGKLISLFDKFAREGTALNMSGGEQEIALTHITDIVRAYDVALELLYGGARGHNHYALVPNQICSLREVVGIFEQQTGSKLNINWGAREYRTREVMRVWQCGECLPGWSAEVKLADGIKTI